jgi:sulfoxide reductase heme-binding subunit YedZ
VPGSSRRLSTKHISLITTAVFLIPAATVPVRFGLDRLGANPIEEITHLTGEWTLRLLVLTLAVTPARRLSGWSWLAPQRRTLGLLTFAYAVLHFATYLALDLFFDWSFLAEDIAERPYITVGFTGFVLLIPLALTSTRAAIRRLGRRWQRLHSLVYVAAAAGVIHFTWLVKADLLEPLVYAAIVAALFAIRGYWHLKRSSRRGMASASQA